ncbi:hypothetical protein [Pedobacter miscanthi]|uniref:hypothetical protein n=1 Tax=Pedobacter miscanthi TaxID=2259170 RepID=UPI001ABFEC2C|nr:hypothetical protein [Pedobacter miscanthi]
MKKHIFNIAQNYPNLPLVDSAISFGPFVKYLQRKIEEEQTVKSTLYSNALKEFKKRGIDDQVIPLDDIYQHELLLEYMYACLSPTLLTENHQAWGLCAPMQPLTFYGTELMYELLEHEKKDQNSFVGSKTLEHTITIACILFIPSS